MNIRKVLRVSLRTNLLSVGKITDRGYKVTLDKEKVVVVDKKGNTILTAERKNSLYYARV